MSAASSSPAKTLKPAAPLGELVYFGIRGRGEPVRLMLALHECAWTETRPHEDEASRKEHAGTLAQPFGQWPLWRYERKRAGGETATAVLAQQDAILRHLARRFGEYGVDADADETVDEILGGVESLRAKNAVLVYERELEPEAKAKYRATHVDPASKTGRNSGAHLAYLDAFAARAQAAGKWVAGTEKPTIADVQVFDIVDVHARIFGEAELRKLHPGLMYVYDRFRAVPSVDAYLGDAARRAGVVNNNGLG